MVNFFEALGTWVEESILKRLQKASVFTVVADEYTDIVAMEELSVVVGRKMGLLSNALWTGNL